MSITLDNYFTANGKYPERATHPELTNELKANAIKLLAKVNPFLEELGVKNPIVSSGFRPSDVNAATPGSAKRSLHMSCLAVDISDPDGKLDALVASRDDLKKKYDLWQESLDKTPKWLHIDCKNRGKRKANTFIP